MTTITLTTTQIKAVNHLTPLTRIQGRWTHTTSGTSIGYKFTNNVVCQVLGAMNNCFKASLDVYKGTQIITSVKEEITSSTEHKFS